MKIIVSEVLPLLRSAVPFVDKGKAGLLPIYNAIKLVGKQIEVFNGECGIIKTTAVNWDEISAAVPAAKLIALLEKVAEQYTEAELTMRDIPGQDQRVLCVKTGRFDGELSTFPLKDYPANDLNAAVKSSVPLTADFLQQVKAARFCCASDLAQMMLASVALRGDKVYAVEAKRMYRGVSPSPFPAEAIVIMSDLVDALLYINEPPVKIDILEGKLVFFGATTTIFGARFADDSRYPEVDSKIDKILATTPVASATYDQAKLTTVLQRLLILNTDAVPAVEITVDKDVLHFKNLKNNEGKKGEDSLECAVTLANGPTTLICSSRLLLDAVSRFISLKVYPQALVFESKDAVHLVAKLVI